jgi:L-seryl-tRNA(Ser) seleniumtransferase
MTPRDLPPVHLVIDRPELAATIAQYGRAAALEAVREALEEARQHLLRGEPSAVDPWRIAWSAAERLERARPRLRPVINATGILLHTGLGRAPLAAEAIEAVARVARGYCNLEVDLATGDRGARADAVAPLLCRLTGAEAATVVNNNAAATVLSLRALASGREVVVSRGQLIEIGGNFRLPEIFAVSGARLVEVGTTNRTRLSDYERAIGPDTAVLLRVHPSNYRVVGFTESVNITELANLAHARGLRTIDDIGSGALGPGLPPVLGEPTFSEGITAGADLVLGSGDKLLGGPQCGLILGKRDAVALASSDPLARAVRVDKMTLAALEATLQLALDPSRAVGLIPLWSFLTTPLEALQARAERIAEVLRLELCMDAVAVETTSYLGGGSLPGQGIPSAGVRVIAFTSEDTLGRALRLSDPAVIARVQGGAVWFDLRAVDPREDEGLLAAIRGVTSLSVDP